MSDIEEVVRQARAKNRADAAVAAYDAHHLLVSWPLWKCSCGLVFVVAYNLHEHCRGMLRLAMETM